MSKNKLCCWKTVEIEYADKEVQFRLCSECRINHATHVRKMNIDKVPREYFLQPTDTSSFILTNTHKINFNDQKTFLNLPREYRLLKYDYYLCSHCYHHHDKSKEPVWTHWSANAGP